MVTVGIHLYSTSWFISWFILVMPWWYEYKPGCGLGYRIHQSVSFFDLRPNQVARIFSIEALAWMPNGITKLIPVTRQMWDESDWLWFCFLCTSTAVMAVPPARTTSITSPAITEAATIPGCTAMWLKKSTMKWLQLLHSIQWTS